MRAWPAAGHPAAVHVVVELVGMCCGLLCPTICQSSGGGCGALNYKQPKQHLQPFLRAPLYTCNALYMVNSMMADTMSPSADLSAFTAFLRDTLACADTGGVHGTAISPRAEPFDTKYTRRPAQHYNLVNPRRLNRCDPSFLPSFLQQWHHTPRQYMHQVRRSQHQLHGPRAACQGNQPAL